MARLVVTFRGCNPSVQVVVGLTLGIAVGLFFGESATSLMIADGYVQLPDWESATVLETTRTSSPFSISGSS
jgi:hypothetical protein